MADSLTTIKKIRIKTIITFAAAFFILLCVSFFYAYFSFNQNVYHLQFFSKYLVTKTFQCFFNNFFYMTMVAVAFCFTVVIGRSDVITSDGKRLLFSQISMPALIILVCLTIIYIMSTEIFLPKINAKIDLLANSTLRANTALDTSNALYDKQQYESCIKYYQEYLSIIEDSVVEERLREVKNKINIPKAISDKYFEKMLMRVKSQSDKDFLLEMYETKINNIRHINKNVAEQERHRIWTTFNDIGFFNGDYSVEGQTKYALMDTTISDKITNYSELADIYFDRRDYLTAWYYYQYTVEKHIPESRLAKQRIDKIKQIMRQEYAGLSDAEFERFISDTEARISNMYSLKTRANSYLLHNQYQKAYFEFAQILGFNAHLRDAIQGQNTARALLETIGVEYSDIRQVANYPSKSNFLFKLNDNKLVNVKTITEIYNMNTLKNNYYLHDVTIYQYDNENVLKSKLYAQYGEIKDGITMTMYCYNIADKNMEFFPTLTTYNPDGSVKSEQTVTDNFIFTLPIDIQTIYHLNYNYQEALTYNLLKLFKLSNIEQNRGLRTTINKYVYEVILANTAGKQTLDSLEAVYNYNETAMNYQMKKDVKKLNLEILRNNLIADKLITENSSLGINKQFINTSICDKIARIFLFLALAITLITICWRLKSTTVGFVSLPTVPFLALIPVFIYGLIKILFAILTALFTTITHLISTAEGTLSNGAFHILLIGTIVVGAVVLFLSAVLLAYNKAD